MNNGKKSMADIRHHTIKKPLPVSAVPYQKPAKSTIILGVKKPLNMDIAKSQHIRRFTTNKPTSELKPASPIKPISSKQITKNTDIKPIPHKLVKNIVTKNSVIPTSPTNAKDIKDAAIAEVFQTISDRRSKEREIEKKRIRMVTIITTAIAVFGIIIYFLYISLPSLSIGIANAKSGTEASLPSFTPSGYSHNGLAYNEGSDIIINFKSTSNDKNFSLKQSKSSWDSSAVKNMVSKESNNQFTTTEKNGLTIFTYNKNTSALWVNGGILYRISSNSSLDISDISQIALSL